MNDKNSRDYHVTESILPGRSDRHLFRQLGEYLWGLASSPEMYNKSQLSMYPELRKTSIHDTYMEGVPKWFETYRHDALILRSDGKEGPVGVYYDETEEIIVGHPVGIKERIYSYPDSIPQLAGWVDVTMDNTAYIQRKSKQDIKNGVTKYLYHLGIVASRVRAPYDIGQVYTLGTNNQEIISVDVYPSRDEIRANTGFSSHDIKTDLIKGWIVLSKSIPKTW